MTYLPPPMHDELRAVVRELADGADRAAAPPRSTPPRSSRGTSRSCWPSRTCSARASRSATAAPRSTRSPRQSWSRRSRAPTPRPASSRSVQKLGALPIMLAGTEEQKDRYLPRLASGEWLAAFALTEAGGRQRRGGNRMRATPRRRRLRPERQQALHHPRLGREPLTVFALTDPEAGGRKGMSAFIVETDTPGFAAPRVEHKMGIRGSPTAELTLRRRPRPASPTASARRARASRSRWPRSTASRLGIAAQAVGIAQGATRRCRRHTRPSAASSASASPTSRASSGCWPTWRARPRPRGSSTYAAAARVDAKAPGPAVLDQQRQARRRRHRHAGHDRCRPGAGRIRLYHRVPRRAHDARREDHPALRGHPADPAPHRRAPAPAAAGVERRGA